MISSAAHLSSRAEQVVPVERCGLTFDKLHEKYGEMIERHEHKTFGKKEKDWMRHVEREMESFLEMYPCATLCYREEPLEYKDFIVKTPVSMKIEDNSDAMFFCKRFRLLFDLTGFNLATVEVTAYPAKNVVLIKAKKFEHRASKKELQGRHVTMFARSFKLSANVDLNHLEATGFSDMLLLIEAPLLSESVESGWQRQQPTDDAANLPQSAPSHNQPPAQLISNQHCPVSISMSDSQEPESSFQFIVRQRTVPPTRANMDTLTVNHQNQQQKQQQQQQVQLKERQLEAQQRHQRQGSSASSRMSALLQPPVAKQPGNYLELKTSKENIQSSPGGLTPDDQWTAAKDIKVGVPVFRDEGRVRRMYLAVDLGEEFTERDVLVQVIKEDRIQISAKRKVSNSERTNQTKFCMNYDLGEKVDPFSLMAGFTKEKKLVLTALAKDHAGLAGDSVLELAAVKLEDSFYADQEQSYILRVEEQAAAKEKEF